METATPKSPATTTEPGIFIDPPVPARRMLTAEQAIENAPNDIKIEYVDDVFPDKNGVTGSVKIRSLTAFESTQVKQMSIKMNRGDTAIIWAEMERMQFGYGVIEPSFTKEQVRSLHGTAGGSFAKVIDAIDKISGINKTEMREAVDDFRGPDE